MTDLVGQFQRRVKFYVGILFIRSGNYILNDFTVVTKASSSTSKESPLDSPLLAPLVIWRFISSERLKFSGLTSKLEKQKWSTNKARSFGVRAEFQCR